MSTRIIEVDLLNDKKQRADFIDVPWQLYSGEPHWVPPLRLAQDELLRPTHPFFQAAKIKAWVAYNSDQKPVARIAAVRNFAFEKYHQQQVGFFGFFECPQNEKLAADLFDLAAGFLRSEGLTQMHGPISPSTNYECGLLVKGFDDPPQIMMTYNPPYYIELFESYGLRKAKDLLAYDFPLEYKLPDIIEKISARAEASHKISYRAINKKRWDEEIDLLLDIYNDAWEQNWGFVPMPTAEFKTMANEMKQIANPELIIFAEVEKKPVAFIVCLPDYNQIFHSIPTGKLLPTGIFKLLFGARKINRARVLTMGVKKAYRKMGLESLLYKKCKEALNVKTPYKRVEMSWILEDNINMNKPLLRMGALPYKTYRLFEKEI